MEGGPRTVGKPNTFLADGVGFLSFAAMAAQAWDLMVSFSDEVEYLWRGRFRFTKALYFGARYGILVMQLITQLLYFRFESTLLYNSLCAAIYVYKVIAAQIGITLVEMILLVRVYALYNQSFKAKRLLMAIFFITITTEFTGVSMVVKALAKASECIAPKLNPRSLVIFGIGAGLCHFVVFTATIAKLLEGGRRRTPLTSLMLKEGVISFILVLVLVAVMIAYEIMRNIYFKDGSARGIGNAAFSWYLALLSIAGSRLILNMRKLAFTHRSILRRGYGNESGASDDDESVQLTSLHDL